MRKEIRVKRFFLLGLGCLVALVAAMPAMAFNSDEIVKGLKGSNIYVAPGVNASVDKIGELKQLMTSGDNIVIVILPTSSLGPNETPADAVLSINTAIGGKAILGVAIGDKLIGYSSILPLGVAQQKMLLASAVSQDRFQALGTFVLNVHDWQAQNPKAQASQPVHKTAKKPAGFPFWIIALLGGIAFIGFFALRSIRRVKTEAQNRTNGGQVNLKKSPDSVRSIMEKILDKRTQIKDPVLRETITKACSQIEAYFASYSTDRVGDAKKFVSTLESVQNVLDVYIRIQNTPDFYKDPTAEMKAGKDAIMGFATFVLNAVQNGSQADLTEFRVDAGILQAKKY